MKRLFKFKYTKLTILSVLIIFTYLIFSNQSTNNFINHLGDLSYLGILIAGMLFSFGFTTPFAVGFFLTINTTNPLMGALIGGVGAMISDIFIFKFIKISFLDEFNNLEKTHVIKSLNKEIGLIITKKIKNYFLFIFAGIIIASPLPDELGIAMLAGLTKIKTMPFLIASLAFNCFGILIMLLI